MSRYYKWQLSRWKRGEIDVYDWRECAYSKCDKKFPIFSPKSIQKCCCSEHAEKFRKERQRETGTSGPRKKKKDRSHIPILCFQESGDCDLYMECYGSKFHKKDGSCYTRD